MHRMTPGAQSRSLSLGRFSQLSWALSMIRVGCVSLQHPGMPRKHKTHTGSSGAKIRRTKLSRLQHAKAFFALGFLQTRSENIIIISRKKWERSKAIYASQSPVGYCHVLNCELQTQAALKQEQKSKADGFLSHPVKLFLNAAYVPFCPAGVLRENNPFWWLRALCCLFLFCTVILRKRSLCLAPWHLILNVIIPRNGRQGKELSKYLTEFHLPGTLHKGAWLDTGRVPA